MPSHDLVGIDWKTVAGWLGWILSVLLSGLGVRIWNQVQDLKDELRTKLVTRQEFEESNATTTLEHNSKHQENTGNFRRLENKIDASEQVRHAEAIAMERRLGELATLIAAIPKVPPRQEGPERRRGY